MSRCVGFGKYERICRNNANGKRYNNPYWCDRCERIRRDAITKQLTELHKDITERHEKWIQAKKGK